MEQKRDASFQRMMVVIAAALPLGRVREKSPLKRRLPFSDAEPHQILRKAARGPPSAVCAGEEKEGEGGVGPRLRLEYS